MGLAEGETWLGVELVGCTRGWGRGVCPERVQGGRGWLLADSREAGAHPAAVPRAGLPQFVLESSWHAGT